MNEQDVYEKIKERLVAEKIEFDIHPAVIRQLIENQAGLRNVAPAQLRPWDRAAKALRIRIKTWMERAAETE